MNKNTSLFLALALSTATGCFFPRGYTPAGNAGAGGNATAAVSASASVDGTLPAVDAGSVDGTTDATDGTTDATDTTDGTTDAGGTTDGGATVPAPSTGGLGDGLDATAMCTKASTCTTRVSMEVCGLFDPKCLDAYHKHLDGATYEKCKAKLDRLPGIVEKTAPAGYALPPECR